MQWKPLKSKTLDRLFIFLLIIGVFFLIMGVLDNLMT
jgi:hypothetical protein